ncbi:MAG: hypothetical protein ACK465_10815, partial [Flavobacteriia bacterium]
SSALLILNDIYEKGFDGHHFVIGLAEHLRNILVCKDPKTASLLEAPDSIKQRFIQQANEIEAQRLLRGLQVLSKTDVDYKASKNQRLLIEVALMQLCSLKQEQEKKKGLTERVDILPFPKQSLRKANSNKPIVAPNSEITTSPPSVPVKEPAAQLSIPQGNVKANIISIRETLDKDKASSQQVRQEDLPRESIHLDHVKMYWKQFAFQVKEDGMETFYNALIKRDPVLKNDEILELTVDNLVQYNYIQTHLLTFKEFMRKQLQNFYLDIVLVQASADEGEIKFLTGKDKFAALARKNPNLHTLKNRFNLDIEY